MSKCKTCGKKCDGDFCFHHKPRKPLKQTRGYDWSTGSIEADRAANNAIKALLMHQFFIEIWTKRPHKSEISGDSLGKEPMSTFFHHILSKEKYPQAQYDEENIVLLTLEEHSDVENDMYKYDLINKRRHELKIKYQL